ncbi:MAG: choice-of-anchor J domain-containing protein [Sodaliphilus sp.]
MLKKVLSFSLALALPLMGAAQSKSVPYFSQLGGTSALDADWTVYNVNGDTKTWTNDNSSSTGYSSISGVNVTAGAKYSYNSSENANDWLVSPAIHLEADKEYKVSFYVKTSSSRYTENLRLSVANSNTADAMATQSETLIDLPEYANTTFTKKSVVYTARETGDYYFGFYEYSQKDMYSLYVTAFQVAENITTPAAVSNLVATVGENEALSVDLSWTLPTTDDDGNALSTPLTGVEVLRDGVHVATLDGTATSWQDSEALGLTSGFHTYSVRALLGNAKSVDASVNTGYVGPIAPQSLPYTADLSSANNVTALFTWYHGPNSTQTAEWQYNTNTYSGNNINLSTSKNLVEDEYLVTPPLSVEEAGAYKVTLDFSAGYYSGEKLELLMGKGKTAEALSIPVATLTNLSSSKKTYEMYVQLPDAGKYYLGLHACSESVPTYGNTYKVYGLKVEKTVIVPQQITDLAAVPAEDMSLKVNLSWTNPTLNNLGTDLAALTKVEVVRGGEVVKTFDNPATGAAMQWMDEVPAPGFYEYQALAYSEGGVAVGTPITVRTTWVGDNTQTLPYVFNFNDTDKWNFYTVVDANADGYSWTYNNGSSYSSGSACNDHSKMTEYTSCSDYLVTPPFNITPGYYRIIYRYNGKGASFKVGTVKNADNPAADFSAFKDVEYIKDYGYFTDTCVVKMEEGGKMCFAFYDYSIASTSGSNKLYITDIQIESTPVVPEVAEGLTGAAASDQSLSASLTWLNPANTNIAGVSLETITKAVILRNGEKVAEVTEGLVPGAISTFVDNTITEPGQYTYSVEIYNENGKSEKPAPSVLIDWVGAGLALPYAVNTTDDSDSWTSWTIVNANNDYRTIAGEEYATTWETSSSSIYYNSGKIQGDDWAMSPRLQFENGTQLQVEVKSYVSQAEADVTWDLAVAPALDHTQMVTVKTITTAASASTGSSAQTDCLQFIVSDEAQPTSLAEGEGGEEPATIVRVTPGVNVIGFHANAIGEIHVKSITIEKMTATGITDLTNSKLAMSVEGGMLCVDGASRIMVFDMLGRKVAESTSGEAINLSGKASGVYVVSAVVNGSQITAKISK